MTCCNRIVCGCQFWEYSNDLDWKEFCVGYLDFIKGRIVFEFIAQLLLINSLKPKKKMHRLLLTREWNNKWRFYDFCDVYWIQRAWQVLKFRRPCSYWIPVNLLSFWYTPVWLFFGISNVKMVSEHSQKYSNSAQAKICCTSEQSIEENY